MTLTRDREQVMSQTVVDVLRAGGTLDEAIGRATAFRPYGALTPGEWWWFRRECATIVRNLDHPIPVR